MSTVALPIPAQWTAGIIDESVITHAVEDGAPRHGVVIWYTDINSVRDAMQALLALSPHVSQESPDV